MNKSDLYTMRKENNKRFGSKPAGRFEGEKKSGGSFRSSGYKPKYGEGDRNDFPKRDDRNGDDAPKRNYTRRDDGENRSFGNRDEKKSFDRPFRSNDDRPRRNFGERNEFPKRDDGERRSFGNRSGDDAPKRNYTRRDDGEKRSYGNRDEKKSFDRPFKSNDDRPRRNFGERNEFTKRDDGERRSFGNRSGDDAPKRNYTRRDDGEKRSYGNRDEKKSFDRPFRSDDDKPRRSFGERKEYPKREDGERKKFGNREDSGQRSYGYRNDRPERNGDDFPKRNYTRRDDGEKRSYGNRDEKKSFDRPYRSNDERPRRNFGERNEFPKRDDGNRPNKRFGNDERPSRNFDDRKPSSGNGYERRPLRKTPEYTKSSSKKTPTPVREDGLGPRLNKFIANSGICSRRQADEYIAHGYVKVNDVVVTEMGHRIKEGDVVKYKDKVVTGAKFVYVLLNKPKDYITTTNDDRERATVMELVEEATEERIYPVGRLDRSTTGLLLFTNDGDLAQKLTHPSSEVTKVYEVHLDRPVEKEHLQAIADGVELEDGIALVDAVDYADKDDKKVIGISIHIGKNRIVRRIFEKLGYDVKKLDRVLYAGLTKKDLPRGKWRFLNEMEIIKLKHFKN